MNFKSLKFPGEEGRPRLDPRIKDLNRFSSFSPKQIMINKTALKISYLCQRNVYFVFTYQILSRLKTWMDRIIMGYYFRYTLQLLLLVAVFCGSSNAKPCPTKHCVCFPAESDSSLRVLDCRSIPKISDLHNGKSTNELFYEVFFRNSNLTNIQEGDLFGIRTKRLDFGNNNNIQSIHARAFSGLRFDLQYLSLHGDGRIGIPFNALQNLFSLDMLVLENFVLPYLDNSIPFYLLPNLKILSLNNMSVGFFSSETFVNPAYKLTDFRFANNPRVSTFPVGAMAHLHHLKKLSWNGNNMAIIPARAFNDLTHLHTLDLSKNELRMLEDNCFSGVTEHLRSLDLSENKLTTISILQEFSKTSWKNLKKLSLSFNQLAFLNHGLFITMENLEHLDLSSNKFSEVRASDFKHLTHLESLDLSENNLVTLSVEALTFTKVLMKLDLQYQRTGTNTLEFTDIDRLKEKPRVQKLYLSNTKLSDSNFWQILQHLPRLSYLHADNSGLSMLTPNEFKNTNLSYISIRHNHLFKLFEGTFSGLEQTLESINLRNNRLNGVEECVFKHLKVLKFLDLSSNLFDCTCGLQWFSDWLKIPKLGPAFDHLIHRYDIKCNTPWKFHDRNFETVMKSLGCESKSQKSCAQSTGQVMYSSQENFSWNWTFTLIMVVSVILPALFLCFVTTLLISMARSAYKEHACRKARTTVSNGV